MQDELLVVKDKIVLEVVDLVKWVVVDDDDNEALNELLPSRPVDNHRKHLTNDRSYTCPCAL